jgi:hypothetical protein
LPPNRAVETDAPEAARGSRRTLAACLTTTTLKRLIALVLLGCLLVSYAQTHMARASDAQSFYEANMGAVKKMLIWPCADPTSPASCMVKSPNDCARLIEAAFDYCWPQLKEQAPESPGPEALQFNTKLAQCVIPQYRSLVAESDVRVENYKVPCRERDVSGRGDR